MNRPMRYVLILSFLFFSSTSHAQQPTDFSGTAYNFKNSCEYPIWLGESTTDESFKKAIPPFPERGILTDPKAWRLNPGESASIAINQPVASLRFWPRTGCTSDGDNSLNCTTGQCGGVNEGSVDCQAAGIGGQNPQTLLETTVNSTGTGNYDVSLVNGYNVGLRVDVDGTCERNTAGCQSDLAQICPTALQLTEPPVRRTSSITGQIPCGEGFCATGSCVDNLCVVGCLSPSDACLQQTNSVTALRCSTSIPVTSTQRSNRAPRDRMAAAQAETATYLDMYLVKNFAGQDASGHQYTGDGIAMASANQGTPTCFNDADCPVRLPSCVTDGFQPGITVPQGTGVCVNPATGGTNNSYRDANITCSASNKGAACSGYAITGFADGLGYTCQPVNYTISVNNVVDTAYVCLPPTTSGLGTKQTAGDLSLYDAGGGLFNDAWLTAAKLAGGGDEGFHEIFKQACPFAYSWQYDDIAADYGCNDDLTSFNVTFCPAEVVAAEPTPDRPLRDLLRRLSPEDRAHLRRVLRNRANELLAKDR